jgi:hypothetical protein
MYEWLTFALVWIAIWVVFYYERPFLRRQMLWVSFISSFTGLLEPLFIPSYWNPPSLFNLNATAHFDIESVIFSFGVGGVASVLYEAALNVKHRKVTREEIGEKRWFHLLSIMAGPIVFVLLLLVTSWNPIYCLTISLFAGASAAVVCRPDLAKNTLLGGILFAGLYFFFFGFVSGVFPSFVAYWNLRALSGVVVLGLVPAEELVYAFAYGMLWSGTYEHIKHYVLH